MWSNFLLTNILSYIKNTFYYTLFSKRLLLVFYFTSFNLLLKYSSNPFNNLYLYISIFFVFNKVVLQINPSASGHNKIPIVLDSSFDLIIECDYWNNLDNGIHDAVMYMNDVENERKNKTFLVEYEWGIEY